MRSIAPRLHALFLAALLSNGIRAFSPWELEQGLVALEIPSVRRQERWDSPLPSHAPLARHSASQAGSARSRPRPSTRSTLPAERRSRGRWSSAAAAPCGLHPLPPPRNLPRG